MKKYTTYAAAALMAGFSSVALSVDPPSSPAVYAGGPTSPAVASTNMSEAERIVFALLEASMQVAEAKIHATSCGSTAGSYQLSAVSDINNPFPGNNSATIVSFGGSYTLVANPLPIIPAPGGQKIDIADTGAGIFDGSTVAVFRGRAIYNDANNILFQRGAVSVVGNNGNPDRYQGRVIKDFYQGTQGANAYEIFDWGLQTLHKFSYPVNKYWQRSKAHRSDGSNGRTVFVKDRLVGQSRCRITVDVAGLNDGFEFIQQAGTLTVSTVAPSTPVAEFSQAPFLP